MATIKTNALRIVHRWMTPIILFGVCVITFGLQILWLGYSVDDWIILYSYTSGGVNGLITYSYMGNRPLVFWFWAIGFKILGTTPLAWHIWTLFWRFLTVLFFWILLREFMPNQNRRTALIALLFAIYPIFFQQPSAITFSFHWICYFLTFLSFYLMVRSVRKKESWLLLSIGSIITGAASVFSQEFFIGLELLRPVLIWFALGEEGFDRWKRLRRTIFLWGPYLLMFIGYLFWRLMFMPTPGSDRNTPLALFGIFQNPIKEIPNFLVMVLRDIVYGLVGVWYNTIQPALIAISPNSTLASWGLFFLVSVVLIIIFLKLRLFEDGNQDNQNYGRLALIFGFLALLVGFAPGWAIGRSISDTITLYNDRFGLAAMAGASLIVFGVIDSQLKNRRVGTILCCLLIGLAAGQHFRSASEYRWSWEKQLRLYWQLKWRAPQLKSPTAIYGNGPLVKYIGSWATVSAVNIIYDPDTFQYNQPYWYFELPKVQIASIGQNGLPVTDTKNNLHYSGDAKDSLVIQANAAPGQCLWVVGPDDVTNDYLTNEVRDAAHLTNLDQIINGQEAPLDSHIFGQEIPRDWCYYYEKADLAKQVGDWQQVLNLWNEAGAKGLYPNVGVEYMPFIDAAAQIGDWGLAQDLSIKAYEPYHLMQDYLCTTWKTIDAATKGASGQEAAVKAALSQFHCEGNASP